MRWIILSNNPTQLQGLLESTAGFISGAVLPTVLYSAEVDADRAAYTELSRRFPVWWMECEHFKDDLLALVEQPRRRGNTDSMLLFTTDTMRIVQKPNFLNVWDIFRKPDVLGVSMCLSTTQSPPPALERETSTIKYLEWTWLDTPGVFGEPFTFGTVYQPNSLLGPMHRNDWDSPTSLKQALCGDAALRRWPRMACLMEATMKETV
jgi:hypothetical protein